MKITWITKGEPTVEEIQQSLAFEYSFRKNMTKILLTTSYEKTFERIEDIEFTFNVKKKKIKVCSKTPEPIYSSIKQIVKKEFKNSI